MIKQTGTFLLVIAAALWARADVELSNLDLGSAGTASVGWESGTMYDTANAFITGPDSAGYSLHYLLLSLWPDGSLPVTEVTVTLNLDDGGVPGESFATLTGNYHEGSFRTWFMPEGEVYLAPNTTYYIVASAPTLENPQNFDWDWQMTSQATTNDDWVLGYSYSRVTGSEDWVPEPQFYQLLKIKAAVVPEPRTWALLGGTLTLLMALSFRRWRKAP